MNLLVGAGGFRAFAGFPMFDRGLTAVFFEILLKASVDELLVNLPRDVLAVELDWGKV